MEMREKERQGPDHWEITGSGRGSTLALTHVLSHLPDGQHSSHAMMRKKILSKV